MIVQCDRCQAKYRIPDDKIKGKGVRVKCTKCQNLFTVSAPPAASEPVPTSSAPVGEGRPAPPAPAPAPLESPAPAPPPPPSRPGLDFEQAFRDGQSRSLGPLSRPAEPESAPAGPQPGPTDAGGLDWGNISLGADAQPSPAVGEPNLGLAAHGEKRGASQTIPPPPEPPPFTPPLPTQEDEAFPPMSPPRAAKAPVEEAPSRGGRGLLVLLLVLVVLGGGGYLAYKDPRVKSLLGMGATPGAGTLVVEDIRVAGLIKRNGVTLAVVRGSVRNNTTSSQGMIRVEAQFKNGEGKVLKRVPSYCGNIFTDRELEVRPSAEILAAMQDELGQSLANSSIPVGQSVPFMVVLEDAPKDIAQVTVTVLSSENR